MKTNYSNSQFSQKNSQYSQYSKKNTNTRRSVCALLAIASGAFGVGCETQLGVQEGILSSIASSSFNGISGVTILSPTSATVTWNSSSKFSSYKVYAAGQSQALASSLFSSATITGLTPNTTYTLSVAGTPTGGGPIFGADITMSAKTWSNFTGVGAVSAPSPTSISASWSFSQTGPTYKVYVNQGSAPTDFSTPETTTQALSAVLTTWGGGNPIQQDTTYYVVVRASYLDNTSEFNSNAVSVHTPSIIDPLPVITTSPVITGKYPVFTVSGGLSSYQTTLTWTTDGETMVNTILGNSKYNTPISKPLAPGVNTIRVSVSYQGYTANLPDITVVSRSLSTTLQDAPLLQGGKGRQLFGSNMAAGDFNCDGYDDLAVSAPLGTFYTSGNSANSPYQGPMNGGVYVFYGGNAQGPGLWLPGTTIGTTTPYTVQDPATTPVVGTYSTGGGNLSFYRNPLLIKFPTNVDGRGKQLFGVSLAAGNLNADTAGAGPYDCDDLAIGAPYAPSSGYTGSAPTNFAPGAVFVYYGSTIGLQIATPVVNSTACSSGTCSPQWITPLNNATAGGDGNFNTASLFAQFGASLAIGKTDPASRNSMSLVVGAPNHPGMASIGVAQTAANLRGQVFVYRADTSGVIFETNATGYASAVIRAPTTAAASTIAINTVLTAAPTTGFNTTIGSWTTPGFGIALALVDTDGDGYDDLYVGSPQDSDTVVATLRANHGSVYYYRNPGAGNGFTHLQTPTSQLQLGAVTGYAGYDAANIYWGGTLAKAGDINGDTVPDLLVGTSLGGVSYGGGGTAPAGGPQIVSVIYGGKVAQGAASAGPQGFTGTHGVTFNTAQKPSAPAINASACNAACVGGTAAPAWSATATYCGSCLVQHFTITANSWLSSAWGVTTNATTTTSPFGLKVAGAKANSLVGVTNILPYGGQRLDQNDSYADVLVGNPSGGTTNSGVVVGLYGRNNGLSTVPTTFNPSTSLSNDATGLGIALGTYFWSGSCSSVPLSYASIGSPNNSKLGNGYLGGVIYQFAPVTCAYSASVTNPSATIKVNSSKENATVGNVSLGGPAGGTPVGTWGSAMGTTSGLNAAPAGDLNGDGYGDLLVAMQTIANYPDVSTNTNTGAPDKYIWVLAVYYGTSSGIDITVVPSINPTGLAPLLMGPATTSNCGLASSQSPGCYESSWALRFLPAGDINNDGFADAIAAGTTGLSIYFGSPSGIQHATSPAFLNTGLDPRWLAFSTTFGINDLNVTQQNLTMLPYNFTYGDFNGDLYSDFVWADPLDTSSPPYNGNTRGTAWVFYGSASGPQGPDWSVGTKPLMCTGTYAASTATIGTATNSPVCDATNRIVALITPCDGSTPNTCVVQQLQGPAVGTGNRFGGSLANAGDVNGDGIDDLIVAADAETTATGSTTGGQAYLFYGSPRGLLVGATGLREGYYVQSSTSPAVRSPVQINPPGGAAGRRLGVGGVAGIGDVNGDGYGDFVISNSRQTGLVTGNTSYGGAFLFYGCSPGTNGCTETGVYSVSYAAGTFTTLPFATPASSCTAGSLTCIVQNAASCVSGGACTALHFQPPLTVTDWTTNYWGEGLGPVGDVNGDLYADMVLGGGHPSGVSATTISNGPTTPSSTGFTLSTWGIGRAILYSGSPTGLVTGTPTTAPQCEPTTGCQPYLLQPRYADWGLIGNTQWHNLSLRQSYVGYHPRHGLIDFNGDSLGDFFLQYDTYWNAAQTGFGMGGIVFLQ